MSIKSNRREWLKLSAFSATAVLFSSFDFPSKAERANNSNNLIKLTSNENPYGFSAKAKQAILDSVTEGNRYADQAEVGKLEQMIAGREGLKPESVVLGTGSGEVLCMAGAAFGLDKGEIVTPDPTFPTVYRYAEHFGARTVKIPLNEKFEHDFPALMKAISDRTSLVYVCNPNNPTAGLSPNDKLREFCLDVSKKVPVFVDEAYLEYTDDFPKNSMVDLVERGNIIVSRTFSKIYGMAGLRIGYGLARSDTAEKLKRFRMTWFNNLSINAALAAYPDQNFIIQSRRQNNEVRRNFLNGLDKMNLRYAPSAANFVWVNTGAGLRDLGDKMRQHNILVRNAPAPFDDWTRVTIGTANEMKIFTDAFRKIAKV